VTRLPRAGEEPGDDGRGRQARTPQTSGVARGRVAIPARLACCALRRAGRGAGAVPRARPAGRRHDQDRTPRANAAIDTAKVREWTKEQGIETKDRGRVPADIVERYKAAVKA
jgi:hypothetical protein